MKTFIKELVLQIPDLLIRVYQIKFQIKISSECQINFKPNQTWCVKQIDSMELKMD